MSATVIPAYAKDIGHVKICFPVGGMQLFEMLRDGARTCWSQCGFSAMFAAGRPTPGWWVIALQQARKDVADLAVNRRVHRIARGLMPLRWPGPIVFLLAVPHLTRLVDAIGYPL
jgi:hypothetical protein